MVVHAADIQDRDGAYYVLDDIQDLYPMLAKIWADQGYSGELGTDILEQYDIILEVVEKLPEQHGFVVLPRRWVVERTFAWISHNRRMSKDYERLCASGEAFVYAAMSRLMLRRLARA